MPRNCDAIVVLSGGMDSATALWWARDRGMDVASVSVNYGQRHSCELDRAATLAEITDTPHVCVDLTSLRSLLRGSALTDDIDVPEGHYASPNMKVTVVPNRNMILLSVAVAAAAERSAEVVLYGAHAGDHPIYPDCRPEFVERMSSAAEVCWYEPIRIESPFLNRTKADVARLGSELGVPWEMTWSCYCGGETHCGRCGTCVERREAFLLAGVVDPTEYIDETPVEVMMKQLEEGE